MARVAGDICERMADVRPFPDSLAYIAMSITGTMWPQYNGKLFMLSQPALFVEVALMLWLVIKGANPPAAEVAV
jgi:hypothetical protein